MSLRTTVILLVLLALVGVGIWWHAHGEVPPHESGRRLFPGLVTGDVIRIVILSERADTPFKGPLTVTKGDDGEWLVRLGDDRSVRARAERVRSVLQALQDAAFIRNLTAASRDALERFGLAPGQRVLVTIAMADGTSRSLALGAPVSEGGVAAQVDDAWPPVEVDRQIQDDLVSDAESWRERRLAPFDSAIAESLRVTFPTSPDARFVARRESGRWEIREPALLPADQGQIMRLIASLSSLQSQGPFDATPAPEVLVRYEIGVLGAKKPFVVEIGDAKREDIVPARNGTDPAWEAVSVAGLELVGKSVSEFRSRRLLHVEAGEVSEVAVSRAGREDLLLKRVGGRLSFHPPPAWGWEFLGRPRTMPIDPSAQTDFLQALVQLEAIDFDPGPTFETAIGLIVKHGASSSENKLRFGRDQGGTRPFSRFEETAQGRVRSTQVAFLEKPYFELLARQVYAGAWFSLAEIEVEEVGKRKVTISAVSTAGNEPDFVLLEPKGTERRRVPREVVTPVADKLSFLTVEKFVAHGQASEFGLDRPQYVIRWFDSAKSQGVAPDSRSGERLTWRVGRRGPDGLNAGELSITPGLIFKTSARDLDPFINLLEWVF